MNTPADTRLIGLFVIGALALAVTLTLVFSGGYLSNEHKYVAYFEGSVNGLNVGAMVKLKGVTIGRVSDVLVQYDMEENRVLTPVVTEIDLDKVMKTFGSSSSRHQHPGLQELIDRGLRARLSLQSLVTSQLYVDINFLPDRPGHFAGGKYLDLPEIPTVASSKDEIEKTLQQLATDVRDMPIKQTVEATLKTIQHVEHLLAKPETDATINNLNQTLADLSHLIRHLDTKVDSLSGDLDGTARQGQTLMKTLNARLPGLLNAAEQSLSAVTTSFNSAKGTLSAVESLAEPDAALNTALHDISDAARGVRTLAETLDRHPDMLLYGRKKQEQAP